MYLSTDGGSWVKQALPSQAFPAADLQLERNRDYRSRSALLTANGVWGGWAYGAPFNVSEYQENYLTTNPAYTGTWTRSAYQPASTAT